MYLFQVNGPSDVGINTIHFCCTVTSFNVLGNSLGFHEVLATNMCMDSYFVK